MPTTTVSAANLTAEDDGLLEREHALERLTNALADVRRTLAGRVVLVSGEAGVGKTTLLRRFRNQLDPTQRLLWGGCDALFTPRPLGPLLAVAEDLGGELAEVVARGVKPHEVVSVLGRHLTSPTVFVLEDAHWADEATLDVLRLLARRSERTPLLLIVSYRDDHLDPNHPLRIVVGELATNVAVERLRIDSLSPEAVAQLAAPHDVDVVELFRKTAGNPFFVVEVLAAGSTAIPETVRDAVLARATSLSPQARQLLNAVAVVPQQAELALIEALAGAAIDSLDECLSSGILVADGAGVSFRHELARLAFDAAIPLNRKVELHRAALAWLEGGDLARLAHHAEAAADPDAVRRYAPAAAMRAAALGAHREAAAQYARALAHGNYAPDAERAAMLERQAHECFLTDQYDEGIAALEEALATRRALGHTVEEADVLRRLSEFHWCPGRITEADRLARDAVALLEPLPPGRELAYAYANLAALYSSAGRRVEALPYARQALELGDALGEVTVGAWSLLTIGACEGDFELMEESLERSRRAGLADEMGRAHLVLAGVATERHHPRAAAYVAAGVTHCSERGLELFRLYLLSSRARLELDQGRWSDAAESAAAVLRTPRTSTSPRITASVVLALVRARRGDPEVWPLLDEAWALAEPTGELPRIAPVAAARAEAAWLEGRPEAIAGLVEASLAVSEERHALEFVGALACWRRRAGVAQPVDLELPAPYALELAGEAEGAAAAWLELDCPYDAALALAQSDEPSSLRRALAELRQLGAHPAAELVARRLREHGVRDLPRGPRPATVDHPAGLTPRQVEVLTLIAAGLRNAEIADRLFLSEKTVDHHVSAILRKLGVSTRGRAAAEAARLGLIPKEG